MAFLALQDLTKRFGEQLAVDGLSLAIERGEFVSLLGPSGCGKTTTLQMIAGFERPSAGTITLEGRNLAAVPPARRGLGVVFQNYALFPHMTAAENVAFGLEMQGIAHAERTQRVRETLQLVGLSGFGGRFPRQLSGGQQQRVALARALVIKPRILLLDEPLSNLDAKLREEMQIELRDIQRSLGTTTLFVTHDQAEAMALSDRIVVMNRGRIEQIAKPHEAYERPATGFVASFLGRTNVLGARVEGVGRGRRVLIGDGTWILEGTSPCTGPASGGTALREMVATIRPERIAFATEASSQALSGSIKMRIFQGSHWLYQIATPAGLVTVLRQNTGEAGPAEGQAVRITWRAQDMQLSEGTGP